MLGAWNKVHAKRMDQFRILKRLGINAYELDLSGDMNVGHAVKDLTSLLVQIIFIHPIHLIYLIHLLHPLLYLLNLVAYLHLAYACSNCTPPPRFIHSKQQQSVR